jgi:hypothetical protein
MTKNNAQEDAIRDKPKCTRRCKHSQILQSTTI